MSGQQLQTMNAIRDASAPFLQGGGSAKAVLYALATFADASGWAWPSLECLGAAAGLSKRSTYPVVEKLVHAGVLDVVKGSQHASNRYRVNVEALRALAVSRGSATCAISQTDPFEPERSSISVPSGEAASPLDEACGEVASPLSRVSGEAPSPLPKRSREAPSPLTIPAGKNLHASGEVASPEGVQEGKEERKSPRPSEIRVIGEDAGTRTPIPDDLALTGDARSYAETIGLRDIDDEWAMFIAHHVKLGDLATTRGWYLGGWRKWCIKGKSFQSEKRNRDAKKQQLVDADVVRPYHAVAKLAPKPPSKVTAGELAGANALANLFKPKAASS